MNKVKITARNREHSWRLSLCPPRVECSANMSPFRPPLSTTGRWTALLLGPLFGLLSSLLATFQATSCSHSPGFLTSFAWIACTSISHFKSLSRTWDLYKNVFTKFSMSELKLFTIFPKSASFLDCPILVNSRPSPQSSKAAAALLSPPYSLCSVSLLCLSSPGHHPVVQQYLPGSFSPLLI